jgi:hypothetical protein
VTTGAHPTPIGWECSGRRVQAVAFSTRTAPTYDVPLRVHTWTERAAPIRPRAVLTQRARAQACRRVGNKDAHAVAAVAHDLDVGWATVMRSVYD